MENISKQKIFIETSKEKT